MKLMFQRAGWRAVDGFLAALAADSILSLGVTEWKVAIVAAFSAGLKPITAYVAQKAGR